MLSLKNSFTEQPTRPEEAQAHAQAQDEAQAHEDAQEDAQEEAHEERGREDLELRDPPEPREPCRPPPKVCPTGTLITFTLI